MKTTLDLPDELLQQVKLRAVHERMKLKDVMAEMIRRGLSQPEPSAKPAERHRVKLPLIVSPPGTPSVALSGEDIDRILMEQEVAWINEAAGR